MKNNYFNTLLIFFSGHGFPGGSLKFNDRIIKPSDFYELINKLFFIKNKKAYSKDI